MSATSGAWFTAIEVELELELELEELAAAGAVKTIFAEAMPTEFLAVAIKVYVCPGLRFI